MRRRSGASRGPQGARGLRAAEPRRFGWVLGGGGARGAYEVGVCDYIFTQVARELGQALPLDVVSGTSVGAIHACAIAAGADDVGAVSRALVARWSALEMRDVVHVDRRRAFDTIRALFGRPPRRSSADANRGGILDPRPLEALLSAAIDFRRIPEHIRARRLHAVSVTATHVASGRTTVFFQGAAGGPQPWVRDRTWAFPTTLSAAHALASAAIPFLFPAVRVRGALYCDGSLRQHVPLSPARRLGARALVVINPRAPRAVPEVGEPERERAFPGPVFLLGKVLNALSLDRVDGDVERLELVNRLLAAGTRQFGPTFVERLNADLVSGGDAPVSPIPLLHLQSSEDIGRLGAAYVRSRSFRVRKLGVVERALTRLAENESETEADLLSYMLFDGGFARLLIDLGRRDAEAQHDRIVAFFRAASEAGSSDAAA
jgi:NTE family protein